MYNEWRPDNWNPDIRDISTICTDFTDSGIEGLHRRIFEAGADAIIQALYREVGKNKLWFGKTDDGHILIYVEEE